jgi:hypothetical protein
VTPGLLPGSRDVTLRATDLATPGTHSFGGLDPVRGRIRRLPDDAAARHPHDVGVPWDPTFTLVRPDDLVVVDVTTELLEARPHNGPRGSARFALHVVESAAAGFIRLGLQPLQVLEYAANEDGDVTPAGAPIFTDRSEIVLLVAEDEGPIEASVAGILAAASRLPIVVDDDPTSPDVDRPGTRLDLPYLLRLRPPDRELRLVHPAKVVSTNGRVGLWSSQLSLPPGDADPTLRVTFDRLAQASAPNTGWATATSPLTLNHTLKPGFASEIAEQSQQIDPVVADDLRVSSLGAWADLRGRWPGAGLEDFTHRMSMGRDEKQTVGVTGRLMPFGHRALFSSETLRRFESDRFGDRRAAALATEATITVTQRRVDLLAARGLPFTSVEILVPATPPGTSNEPDDPDDEGFIGRNIIVLTVHGEPYRFPMRATDHAGATVDFDLPLMFVPDDENAEPPTSGRGASDELPDLSDDSVMLGLLAKQPSAFTTVHLDGQGLTVSPPTDDEEARANGVVTAAPVTRVLARTVKLAPTDPLVDPGGIGTLKAATINAVVPTLDRFAPDVGALNLSYALPYLEDGFAGDNSEAQVFLEVVKGAGQQANDAVVGMAGEAVGGMAQLGLPVTAFSRQRGAVVGAVSKLLAGEPDLDFLQLIEGLPLPKLLGVVPLKDLIPLDDDVIRDLGDAPKIVSDVAADGKITKDLTWETALFKPDKPNYSYVSGRVVIAPFPSAEFPEPKLTIKQSTTLDATGQALHSRTEVTVVGFALKILVTAVEPDEPVEPDREALVTIPFKKFSFVSTDGTKPDFDVTMGALGFGGILRYIRPLIDLIDQAGFTDPPALAVTDTGVLSSFHFPVPSLAIGVFTLQNINIGAELEIFFAERAPELRLFFSREADPFRLTVSFLGGGGWLELTVSTGGLEQARGALEFGAAAALDVVVATVSVEAMGGVQFMLDADEGIAIEAYLRLRGHVDVASLISADILLLLILLYVPNDNVLIGHGELVLQLKCLFVSESLRVPVTRQFAGGNADPTFAELMAPEDEPGPPPWDVYCTAFVEE